MARIFKLSAVALLAGYCANTQLTLDELHHSILHFGYVPEGREQPDREVCAPRAGLIDQQRQLGAQVRAGGDQRWQHGDVAATALPQRFDAFG